MELFLSGFSKTIIKLIGLWESDVLLKVITEQVENFTFGVSQNMIKLKHFHNVNTYQIEEDETKQNENNEDAPVIFPTKLKLLDSKLGANNTKKKSIKKKYQMSEDGGLGINF